MNSNLQNKVLKVALIGCGKIADQHVLAVRRIAGCELAGVCDRELLMARQLAERFGNPPCYSEVDQMLAEIRPDVVHIATPPQSHYSLGKQCVEAGCHLYIEKPFTINIHEAVALMRLAEDANLKLTVGHNLQFTPEMIGMRKQIAAGFLGGKPVHMESYFPYNLEDQSYVAPILGDRNHWVRRLPGKLFHNVLSHGIAKLAEFLDDDLDEIKAMAHQSRRLLRLGCHDFMDELRVMLRDHRGTTAFFTFSTEIQPGMNQLRLFGRKNSLMVDHGCGSLIRYVNHADKSYLTYVLPPLRMALEQGRCAYKNVKSFACRELYQDAGMKELIERFYRCIQTNAPLPIPFREILLTVKIMDTIFSQIRCQDHSD